MKTVRNSVPFLFWTHSAESDRDDRCGAPFRVAPPEKKHICNADVLFSTKFACGE